MSYLYIRIKKISDKPLKLKIDCLIAALTLDTMTNGRIFGVEDGESIVSTGMELLDMLGELIYKEKTYLVEVQTVNGEIDIKNTSFLSGTNKYVYISKLFTMILE
jgi:hypothetical protein